MVDSDPKTDLTGLTTDLYIIAGSLGGVCLILIIWQIIVSVQLCNLRKRLTKRVQSNEHEPQIVENVPRPNFESGPTKVDDVASRYVQYPPQPQPHMNNQAMSLPYGGNVEAKYDPQIRHVMGPQVLPHPVSGHGGRNYSRTNSGFVEDRDRPSTRTNRTGGFDYGY